MRFGLIIRRYKRVIASVVAVLLAVILAISIAAPFFGYW